MRAILSLFLSALFWATSCAYAQTDKLPYEIDEQVTAQAPWMVGNVIAEDRVFIGAEGMFDISRKFIGLTNKGFFVVQDFYKENNKKMSNPIAITQQDFVTNINQSYENRPFDGMLIVWYENGQKNEEVLFQVGEPQGLWTSWYSNGQKMSQSTYQDGEKKGSFTIWNSNGQQKIHGQFQDGKKQGLETRWYENGGKMLQGKYKDGLRQGLWIKWNEEGQKISETMYENDEVVSKKTFN